MRQRIRWPASPRTLIVAAAAVSIGIAAWNSPALAYRPFDGTDAAVAKDGEMEVELQPAGPIWERSQTTLIAPATRLNFGMPKDWELVIEGQGEWPLSPSGPARLADPAVFLKHVLHPGSLQDKSGWSVATEFGVLLPDSTDAGVGASLAGVASQRWDWGAVHFNAATAITRDHHADVFLSTILEGPSKWTVRPVAEVFYEQEFGVLHTISGLVGAIWQVKDDLSFDVGFRHALTNGHTVNEIRAGLTFGFPLKMGNGAKNK
ncbi:MAG: hypothetical protein C5B56_08230 [Proteobacteria bacterium]|nr:MAG: hypothetical protein C5B56_08230 [Pseudomonadota bacterium]